MLRPPLLVSKHHARLPRIGYLAHLTFHDECTQGWRIANAGMRCKSKIYVALGCAMDGCPV
jgi:hypothetical protein